MGSLFLFTGLVHDLNNVSQFTVVSCCLSDIYIKKNVNVFTGAWECVIVEFLVYLI